MSQQHSVPVHTGRDGAVATSLSQARLWFADQIGRRGTEFLYPYALRLTGELDVPALAAAVDEVVARHEPLRTTFSALDGDPRQVIRPPFTLGLTATPLAVGADGDAEAALDRAVRAVIDLPFDLVEGPVLRARLFTLGPAEHVFLLVIHHIATDGWSMEILFRELEELYRAFHAGRRPDLPDPPLQFADVAAWERQRHADGGYTDDLAFWRSHLDGCPHALELPLDRPRPALQSFDGGCVTFTVPAALAQRVDRLARSAAASPYMVLLSAFQLLLGGWSGRYDLIVGLPVANRELPETERLVGFFMNLLPLRARIDLDGSFRRLLTSTRDAALDAYDHQAPSFGLLVEAIAPDRTLAHNPLVQVTFNAERELRLDLPGLGVDVLAVQPDVTRYDLAFDYDTGASGELRFTVFYASDLFDRATVTALTRRYVHLLDTCTARPDTTLAALPPLPEAEEAGVLARGSRSAPAAPARDLLDGFARAAAARPGAVAVVDGDTTLTFAELGHEADRIAAEVLAQGVGPDDVVAVALPRSARLLTALLGILRAGAAVLPLDPAQPLDRLRWMVTDSGSTLLLTDERSAPELGLDEVTALRLDAVTGRRPAPPVAPVHPDRVAYVMYTSGSTGRPKGVQVSRGSVAALLTALEADGVIRAGAARVGWNASPTFDASVQQWLRVCRGDTVVVLAEPLRRDPAAMAEFVVRERLSDLDITPSHAAHLVGHLSQRGPADGTLRLWVGGDALPANLWAALAEHPGVDAVNVYGTTETTVDTTWAPVEDGQQPHLGTVLPGQVVRILDEWLRPVPAGTPGELHIGGTGPARGYLRRPGLTASRFVPDPQAADGSRLYRTGDRARWRQDGRLEFLGRLDHQVKVRGYRVEPGEVESVLREHPEVLECVVVKREQDGEAVLCAYVRATPAATVPALREHARSFLAEWLRPSAYVLLDSFPTNPAGKVDRPALAAREPVAHTAPAPAGPAPGTAARSSTEDLLIRIWQDVLGGGAIGPDDHFFQSGGHSLLAIRVVARLKRQARIAVPMTAVFENPVLRDLAAVVEDTIRAQLAAADTLIEAP